jgi:serine/threonine-protein kinase
MTEPLEGRNIGLYRIEAEIGEGRWGKVYRATQAVMNRAVALKVLSSELAELPGKVEHFREELRRAARPVHPNIVTIYEAGYADGAHYCAEELLDGPPLEQFLRRGAAVDESRLLQTVAGISRALDYLWRRGLKHPRPAANNIRTNAAGKVKLVNIVPAAVPASESPAEDIAALGAVVGAIANATAPVSRAAAELVERMVGAPGRKQFASLTELADAAEALERSLERR